MMEMGSKQYKKWEVNQVRNGDIRNRIIKYDVQGMNVNMLMMGIVQNNNDKGCFIRVGHKTVVRAQKNELEEWNSGDQQMNKSDLCLCRVILIKDNGQIEVSSRKSIVVGGVEDINDIQMGMQI